MGKATTMADLLDTLRSNGVNDLLPADLADRRSGSWVRQPDGSYLLRDTSVPPSGTTYVVEVTDPLGAPRLRGSSWAR